MSKEPHFLSKEPYILSKEPYIQSKESPIFIQKTFSNDILKCRLHSLSLSERALYSVERALHFIKRALHSIKRHCQMTFSNVGSKKELQTDFRELLPLQWHDLVCSRSTGMGWLRLVGSLKL